MTLIIFVKWKVDFKHVEIWLWICLSNEKHIQIWHTVCLSKENLTLNISKYDIEYDHERKSWLWTCPNMTLGMFVKRKIDFKHIKIWHWVFLSKEKLTLDITKNDFKYVCQRKSWFYIYRNMTLNMFVKGKVDFKCVEI
jgi:hypothetical protein